MINDGRVVKLSYLTHFPKAINYEGLSRIHKTPVNITDTEEAIINSKLKNKSYLKSQYILQAGDVCRYQTFIVSGKVRTFYLGITKEFLSSIRGQIAK